MRSGISPFVPARSDAVLSRIASHGAAPAEPVTIVDRLEHWAEEAGSRAAFTFLASSDEVGAPADRMTFADLRERAREVAGGLSTLCARGDRVLLLYPPSLEYIVGLLGAMYAGLIAVPAYPPHRRRAARVLGIAGDATPSLALTDSASLERVRAALEGTASGGLPCVATDAVVSASRPALQPLRADDIAFLQYTSGSTGQPKGVCVTHAALVHNQRMIRDAFGTTRDGRIVGWLPIYHDMGLVGTVLHAVYMGIESVLMAPAQFLQRPARWLEAISQHGGTISGGPDAAFALCAERVTEEEKASLDLSRWTIAFNGSERVRPETMDRFTRAFARCGFRRASFYPCYGLAEATLIVTGGRPLHDALEPAGCAGAVDVPPEVTRQRFASCGRAVRSTDVRIVDAVSHEPLPDGAIGEIWVRGPAVCRGYWKDDALSAAFGASLAGRDGERYLRTGDLGFVRDGELFPAGRLKDLIVVRGLNYFPEDIERCASMSHAAARHTSAAFSIDTGEREKVVVVVELDRRIDAVVRDVVNAVRQAIGVEFQLQVDAIVLVQQGTLPKTSSGKLQRGEVRRRYLHGGLAIVERWEAAGTPATANGGEPLPEPRDADALARWMAAAVSRWLDGERVEADARLAEVGVDSLSAIDMVHRMEAALGRAIPARLVFEGATLRDLARLVAESAERPEGDAPVAARTEAAACPLAPGQLSLWLLQQITPGSDAYHVAIAVELAGTLDRDVFRAAVENVLSRHSALRTTFGDGPVQRVHERVAPLGIVDAGGWRQEHLDRAMAMERHAPFDPSRDLPARSVLYCVAPARHVLLLVLHHIVCDGWSVHVVYEDLLRSYERMIAGLPADPPPPQLHQYVRWQAEHLATAAVGRQADYWRQHLASFEPLALPGGTADGRAAIRVPLHITGPLADRVARAAQQLAVTPYVWLATVLQVALHHLTSRTAIAFGTDAACRPHHWMQSIVGMLANQVVLYGTVAPDETFEQTVARARALVAGALSHQDLPFAHVVSAANPRRQFGSNPLFQVMFAFRNRALPVRSAAGVAFSARELPNRDPKFDATLALTCEPTAISGAWEFSAAAVEAGWAERLAAIHQSVLSHAAERPSCLVRDLLRAS